jgi:hypothetical protein
MAVYINFDIIFYKYRNYTYLLHKDDLFQTLEGLQSENVLTRILLATSCPFTNTGKL